MHIFMQWSYYLGQIWPVEVFLFEPSLFLKKLCASKKHYNIGVSVDLLKNTVAQSNFRYDYLGQIWHFDVAPSLAQVVAPQNGDFSLLFFLEMLQHPLYSVFNINQNLTTIGQRAKTTTTLQILKKSGY